MIDKLCPSAQVAVAAIPDGATVAVGGFGGAGMPNDLIDALIEHGARDLTLVSNNAGQGDSGLAALLKAGQVRRILCSYPRMTGSHVFEALYRAGKIELEIVPQGNLAERLRAAGCGIEGFYTPTGYGTLLANGKETRLIGGRQCVLETPIHVDYALIKADVGDRWGNLTFRKTARNFGPVMAMAAKHTIASIGTYCQLGEIDPEHVITPGIFVKQLVLRDAAPNLNIAG
ncbi:3-oxoacid CoA-transferase subunit A [Pseudomonas fulva]|uniref:3-oxoadipate CoA-transferase n=1 Tax=Pseudomonas putida TaxID=303 RepID=A0A7W2L606_PSEPU|nr:MULTISPECIES: 3-oxoacid CoA-transferase subunit A [Pseudomonas]MBA1223713.1 3-oxoacid CoA-transferase subunit A [Pseudomonas fulva]MBA6119102.1 3-oxoacid CoA-transferase subunit A [Pseudomonas putida]MEC4879273.1 3-oxoacid CoA-transferase subunit A [Pseudomonas sp. NC26]